MSKISSECVRVSVMWKESAGKNKTMWGLRRKMEREGYFNNLLREIPASQQQRQWYSCRKWHQKRILSHCVTKQMFDHSECFSVICVQQVSKWNLYYQIQKANMLQKSESVGPDLVFGLGHGPGELFYRWSWCRSSGSIWTKQGRCESPLPSLMLFFYVHI